MTNKVVWHVREQVADLARYYDTPSHHAEMLAEARDALDGWLALLVAEEPVPEADMLAAKRLVAARLFTLTFLVNFPEGAEVNRWTQSLVEVGLLSGLE